MPELVKKSLLRTTVEDLSSRRIYSTANMAGNQYRMSIPWHGGYRRCKISDVPQAVWETCNEKRDAMIDELESTWPQLAGQITSSYHIGSGIYLSLRVNNAVLTR